MVLINEIYIDFSFKINNLITYKGISYLVFFLDKLNQLLLKLGFIIKIIILIIIK